MKSAITVDQQKGAVKPQHRENCLLLLCCMFVSITPVCRPVPEDLQWALIIIQNHILARLVILLHKHTKTHMHQKSNHCLRFTGFDYNHRTRVEKRFRTFEMLKSLFKYYLNTEVLCFHCATTAAVTGLEIWQNISAALYSLHPVECTLH